jgi:hypothetical protein
LRDEFLNENETLGSFGLATVGRGLDQPNPAFECLLGEAPDEH